MLVSTIYMLLERMMVGIMHKYGPDRVGVEEKPFLPDLGVIDGGCL